MNVSPLLFSPLKIRDVEFRNRIAVSPMCQYVAVDGFVNDWHFVHLGSRATGGAGLVFVEATAVEARGRITPGDVGLWKDEQIGGLARIAEFVKGQGAAVGIQLAHAGRKASSHVPWEHQGSPIPAQDGGWTTVAPSPVGFRDADPVPAQLTLEEIKHLVQAFVDATQRAVKAGFQVIELHAAHGYLIHEFLSPLSNLRTDEYGGAFENRIRLALELSTAMRSAMPGHMPLFVRISASDWVEGGWDIESSVELSRRLKSLGVDLIDCSSGGLVPYAKIEIGPGYQVPFARRVKKESKILTGAVGLITDPDQAETILQNGEADIVLLARELLRDPYWPLHAARKLGVPVKPPVPYGRAFTE